jgi:hypothetical protein
MFSAHFVYLSIFTIANFMVASYLQTAVNVYKAEGKLPDWVIYFRNVLEHLDEPCDGNEFKIQKDSNEEPSSPYNFFKDLKEDQKPVSMPYLQIKPFQENGQMYDFRDEHEYKMSKKSETNIREKYKDDNIDTEFIDTMNSSREAENKWFRDLSQVEKDLYANDNERSGQFSKNPKTFTEEKTTDRTIDELGIQVEKMDINSEK